MYFKHEWRKSGWFKSLSKQEIQVVFYLNNFADKDGQTDISITQLMSLGKLCNKFFHKWLKNLEQKGLIKIKKTCGKNNFYSLLFYAESFEPVNVVHQYTSFTSEREGIEPVNARVLTSERRSVEPVNDVHPLISFNKEINNKEITTAGAEWSSVPETDDFEKISNFIKRLKGKIPDTVIDFRLEFFKELFKYKKLRLSQIQSESLIKILRLKKDYKTIIEKNYSIDLSLLIDMCIQDTNKKVLEKNPALAVYDEELKQQYVKQGVALCTGTYNDKKVTDTVFYHTFLKTGDFKKLSKLYFLGKEKLLSENKEIECVDYSWLLEPAITL